VKTPLVTIGMPVYNGAPYVAKALDALLAQDYPRLEILVSDNASSDETPRICEERARRDPRLSYLRNDANIGATANFRRVLSLARGEYFMWAAHDDLWEPTFVSTLAARLDADDGLVLAMSHYDRFSHVTDEVGTVPWEGYPAVGSDKSVFENCRAYLRKGSSELVYGMFRIDVLRRTRFAVRSDFDWSDVFLVNEMCTLGRIHLEPTVLFHTGFVAPRPARSISRRRLPGFKLAYGRYYLESARCFLRAPTLRSSEKLILLALLSGQVASMVYSYELPQGFRSALQRLRDALRLRRPA
jgi:glycosyltransferase involved in cell wall biosynthesis